LIERKIMLKKECAVCHKSKIYSHFRYTSQREPNTVARRIFSDTCAACRKAALVKDARKLHTAVARCEIAAPIGSALLAKRDAKLRANRAAAQRQGIISANDLWTRRRFLWGEYGLDWRDEARLRLSDPAAADAFVRKLAEASRKYANIKARAKRGDRGAQKKMQMYLTKGAKVTAR
jgi:hypothetical protein